MTTPAYAYMRTSSATNVGADKDSDKRQRAAISAYALLADYDIRGEYYDAAVPGADPVTERPAFAEMMTAIAGNGVRTILVESASRFARDLIVQETGYSFLKGQQIDLIAVDDPDAFTAETPTAVMVRQILGAVSQFEKANLVAKLAAARARKRAQGGHAQGLKPAPVAARTLARSLRGSGATLREIASQLAQNGFLSPSGRPYLPESVKCMLPRDPR